MRECKVEKDRTCLKCGATLHTTAAGVKAHAEKCKGEK